MDYMKIVVIIGNSGWNGYGNGNIFYVEWYIYGVVLI